MTTQHEPEVAKIGLTDKVVTDLAKSGLEPKHVAARTVTTAELAATRTASSAAGGYVIPYFDIYGKPVQFYRIRMFDQDPKYKQPYGEPNHIYFPPELPRLLAQKPNYLLIVEGEKKAAAACRKGFPAIAVTGVDSWRNRMLLLPEDTQFNQIAGKKTVQAKLPSGSDNSIQVMDTGPLAVGMKELIDYLVFHKMQAIIVYDTDNGVIKPAVQTAAAKLGYELRYRGLPISHIRQIMLPGRRDQKVGLDDYLMDPIHGGVSNFASLVRECKAKRVAFPRHPNPKVFVSTKLQKSKMNRKEAQDVALAVLMEMEARGKRLRSEATNDLFYFDEVTHTLMEVFLGNIRIPLHETSFGAFLYREFNLGSNDRRVLEWLASQFTGEPTVFPAKTHRVLAKPVDLRDCIAYQTSDSDFVIITPDPEEPFIACKNGDYGILFEQGQVEPVDIRELEVRFYKHLDATPQMYWSNVLAGMNFRDPTVFAENSELRATADQTRLLAGLLFYMSPWLLRWRGTQLPVELVIGEAGSGKSTLYSVRQQVLVGRPKLRNMTNDIKDWYAGISKTGGLYVMDNVHFVGGAKDYRQRLSDEFCRLVTEPDPHVELRKLYTTNDIASIPVTCTFAVTSIEQPFFNVDLIQRAAIFEMDAIKKNHDADWANRMMSLAGGRIGWVAHHLEVLHKFLKMAITDRQWNPYYKATHRLANYEQCLTLMARVFGLPYDWIPHALEIHTSEQMSEADWTMQGIKDFVEEQRAKYPDKVARLRYTVQDIVTWAEMHDRHSKNGKLTNPYSLGRYLASHKESLSNTLGFYTAGKQANRQQYGILDKR